MSIQIKGTVIHVGAVETVGAKGFQKRMFVVQTDEKYPQEIPIELAGEEKVKLGDTLTVGDVVTVSVNLKGRKWNGPNGVKWFGSTEAWRIEGGQQQRSASGQHEPANAQDDVPF